MTVKRHFSDTRTDEGRIRFLIGDGEVQLIAEGPGWRHDSMHGTLAQAVTFLATVLAVPQKLYGQALDDLERQIYVDGTVDLRSFPAG